MQTVAHEMPVWVSLREMLRIIKPGGKLSFLIPSEQMTVKNAQKYAKKQRFEDLDTRLLELWAQKAPSLNQQEALVLANRLNLKDIQFVDFLGDMLTVVTGTKQ